MVYELRHQPFRALYIAYELVVTLVGRLPFWVLLSIPRCLRPRRSWTLGQAIYTKLLRRFGPLGLVPTRVGMLVTTPTHVALDPKAVPPGVWINPVPELITGEVKEFAAKAGVEPARIPGYWYFRKGLQCDIDSPATDGEKVFYLLHGGGYIFGSASPNDLFLSRIPRALLESCPGIRRAFAVEYRLSVGEPLAPCNPFPAALIDALAGYCYLVNDLGFAPEQIIVEGDSAGGNLALALTRYLVEGQRDAEAGADGNNVTSNGDDAVTRQGLPAPPGSVILLSPWTDISHSHYEPGSSGLAHIASDFLLDPREGSLGYACRAFCGPHGAALSETNRYVSPACRAPSLLGKVSFRGFPRTYISAGDAEQLLDQIRTLRDLMVKDMGEDKVTYDEAPDAPHDFIIVSHEPQCTHLLRNIGEWLAH